MKKLIPFLALLLVICATDAFAFSCHGKFISVDMRTFDVLDRCGEPEHVESWQENEFIYPSPGYIGNYYTVVPTVTVNYEEWVYNLGPTHFMPILTFRNGRLVRIRQGNYGY